VRRTISDVVGNQQHAIYERTGHNDAGEWEFTLVRVE